MIAVDTNILVYAHRLDSAWNRRAAAVLVGLAEGRDPWAIPWPCVHEFFSIVTHARIFSPPTPASKALQDLDVWFLSPTLRLIGETEIYWPALRSCIEKGSVAGPLVHDARVAAICRVHGVSTLLTADRDFSRFRELKVQNPL
ncbi:MAG: PIN domain-containing protein [Candidatus Solibacter usitatus]|nr:PIN domain-containing protein [Candidatus Solibacter usitatus]